MAHPPSPIRGFPCLGTRFSRAHLLILGASLATAISALNAGPALAIEHFIPGPEPASPVIGLSVDQLNFAACLEPDADCDERSFELFNNVQDPSSILEVTEILVAGADYLLIGPPPPLSIPGDGSRITYTVRFCPATGLPAPGAITVSASNAANSPQVLSLSGDGNSPPECDAGGPYFSGVGVPVQLDARDSRDPDPDGEIVSYIWDFGDGATGTGAQTSHAYQAVGVYSIHLTTTDNCAVSSSCTTSATITLGNQPPICDAGGPYAGFNGVPITFDGTGSSDPDGIIVAYAWNFGDGQSGGGPTVNHAYAAPGNYFVSLRVTDNGGRSSICQTLAVVALNLSPVCDHGGPYSGHTGTPIQFDGTGSQDPDGVIASYHWAFGDGATSVLPSPVHAYSASGLYDVVLTVRDDRGAASSCLTRATVLDNVPPTCDAGGPYVAAVGAPIHFDGTDSSDPNGTIVQYQWSFGDGAQGTGPTPIHSYSAVGDYSVQLCVTDNLGAVTCCTTLAHVLGGGNPLSPVIGVDPTAIDFGDCNPLSIPVDRTIEVFNEIFDPTSILHLTAAAVTGAGFSVTGPPLPIDIPGDGSRVTFTLHFTPTNPLLALGFFDLTAPGANNSPRNVPLRGQGNAAPICDAGGPYEGGTGQPIAFDGTGSSDPGGTSLLYRWDFGDGATGTGATTSHTYLTVGTFQVVLTLTDDCEVMSSCTTTAAVIGTPICDAGGPYQGLPGLPIQFDGTGSSDPDGFIVSYDWDFGDGGTGTGPTPTHTYFSQGLFIVTLTVTDNDAHTSTCQTTAFTVMATPVEIASFDASPTPEAVAISWRFTADGDFLGFELWRREANQGPELKLHEGLLEDEDHDGTVTFQDTHVRAGASYEYTLVAMDRRGESERVGPLRVDVPLPALALRIAPNPSRPPFSVAIDLPGSGPVRVWIADATGRIVRQLTDEYRPAGTHALTWDGRDGRGISTASGIYFMLLERGADVRRVKLVLVR